MYTVMPPLLHMCKTYIDKSNFSTVRKSQIDYAQYQVMKKTAES